MTATDTTFTELVHRPVPGTGDHVAIGSPRRIAIENEEGSG